MFQQTTSLPRALLSVCLASLLSLVTFAHPPAPEGGAKSKRPAAAPAAPATAGQLGQWGDPFGMRTVPIHISLLPDGRLLYWGRDKENNTDRWDVKDRSLTYVMNLANRTHTEIPNETTNLFCSGHSFLPDGRLLVSGGHDRYDPRPLMESIGEKDLNVFDYRTNRWTRLAQTMQNGRWYPFHVTLEDGSVMIHSGNYWDGTLDSQGKPRIFLNDVPERFFAQTNGLLRYTNAAGSVTKNYPLLHLLPDGRVLVAAPFHGESNTTWIDPSVTDPNVEADGRFGPHGNGHEVASSVLYDAVAGKVLVVGGVLYGTDFTINRASAFDFQTAGPSSGWSNAAPMANPRQHHTATLLPDGKVIVTGGSRCGGRNRAVCFDGTRGDVSTPELWDPNTAAWQTLAPSSSGTPRLYHSTAILLPDATVMVGGGGLPAAGGEVLSNGEICRSDVLDPGANCRSFGHSDAEIFSPPYLFTSTGQPAPRPVINSAPSAVPYGQPFFVGTGNPSDISSAVLVRLGSVTHGFNQDQRRVVLNFTPSGNGLSVTAPANGKVAPPGPYMLFLLNQAGTPSVAKMVTVGAIDGEPFVGRRAVTSADKVYVFYRHADDTRLRYMAQSAPDSQSFTAPVDLGGLLNSNPLAIQNADGRLEAVVLGADNQLYSNRQTAVGSNTWSGFRALRGVSSLPTFALASNIDGRLQAFYRDGNHNLSYVRQSAPNSTTWEAPTSLGGTLTSEPAVGMNADGRLQVFVRGTDNGLHYRTQTAPGSNTWTPWRALGGYLTAAPHVAHNADGRLSVFVRGSDYGVYHIRQSAPGSDNWVGYEALGGSVFDHPYNVPVASRNADGRLQLFVRWSDNTLRTMVQDAPSGNFPAGGWANLWGAINATIPPPPRSRDGRLFMFARGMDIGLYVNPQLSPNAPILWNGFTHLGDYAHSF